MADPRHSRTNAADSAPGVDDGRKGAGAPGVNSKPGGRLPVLLIVAAALAILALVFIARPQNERADSDMVKLGATQGEMAATTEPGAVPPTPPVDSTPR